MQCTRHERRQRCRGAVARRRATRLKQALEHAPVLQTESLGEPARGVNVWERWLVPNPDGKSWDLLQIYFKEYYGPTWLCAVDLGTGEVKKQRLADGHQFYLSGRALGFDGKYYIATPSRRTWSMDLFVYDPATNTLEERGEIVPGLGGEVRPLVVGPDGRIYGTGTRGNQVGLYIYDPKLGKVVKDFGAVGPKHPNGAWSRYVMGVDDTHAYIASGMIPAWYLVAVNLKTGEQKVLLESPTERVMDILESFPGALRARPPGAARPIRNTGSITAKRSRRRTTSRRGQNKILHGPKPCRSRKFTSTRSIRTKMATRWFGIGHARMRAQEGESISRSDQSQRQARNSWAGNPFGSKALRPIPIGSIPCPCCRTAGSMGRATITSARSFSIPKPTQTTYCGPRVGLAPYTTIVSWRQALSQRLFGRSSLRL